jgi:predicted phage terminase large subunit-like protein
MASRRHDLGALRARLARLEELHGGADAVLAWPARLSPGYERPDHLRPLADAFARATAVGGVREMFSTFPRAGKTELSMAGLVRNLVIHPERTNAFIAYSAEFAEIKSRRVRDLAEQAGVRIRTDARRLGAWQTEQGGGLLAVGLGGPLVGLGIDGIAFCDDLYKNRDEAESEATRAAIEGWFTGSLLTRIQGSGSVIICSSRWTPRDLIGTLAEAGWKYSVVPALDDAGESTCPSRWPTAALRKRMAEVGPFDWNALYQGNPRPRGGAVFEGDPSFFEATESHGDGWRIYLSCDPAATAHDRADHSVVLVGATRSVDGHPVIDVLDVWRERVEVPALVARLVEMQRRYRGQILVESVGAFKAVTQVLRQMAPSLNVVEVSVGGASKFTRAQPAAGLWRAGRIRLARGAAWVPAFVAEVQGFTGSGGSERDDQVDALSHLANRATEHDAQAARELEHFKAMSRWSNNADENESFFSWLTPGALARYWGIT